MKDHEKFLGIGLFVICFGSILIVAKHVDELEKKVKALEAKLK